jgi:transposase
MNTGTEKKRTADRELSSELLRALMAVRDHVQEYKLSPSLEEIAAKLSVGKSTAKYWVDALRQTGHLDVAPGRYRNLIVTRRGHSAARLASAAGLNLEAKDCAQLERA